MTRIFDALRKARFHAPPSVAPPPPAPAAPPFVIPAARSQSHGAPLAFAALGEVAAPRPMLPPPALVSLPSLPPMGEDVLREMGTLRVHLESALTARTPRTVILVSAQGGEGTTTVATQFAAALVRDNSLRVLLVDAHARRPALTEWTASGAPKRSAFGAMRKPAPPPDPAASERLRLLPVPDEYKGPGGAITAAVMRQLLDSVEAGFDWVIIDGSPVLESPDSASLATAADGVVMVVQAGRTKRPVLSRSVELLRKAGARVLGTVLNRRRLEIPGFIYRRI
jgi:Mrp family chromosome partitioning ATPase